MAFRHGSPGGPANGFTGAPAANPLSSAAWRTRIRPNSGRAGSRSAQWGPERGRTRRERDGKGTGRVRAYGPGGASHLPDRAAARGE
ncbi:hypothetical protein GCM10010214_62310 [Streptomyces abikoensis]|nr:hypothetical protein GCM10010214_62310 [Streptomyces abikoensis]